MANESVKKHVLELRSELEKTREQRDTHLRRAEQITTTELQQARKERLLNHGKVHTKHEATVKVLKEAKVAISEFESASDGIQQLGQKLDTALRGLGDVENFLDILSERTQKVSERIVHLLSSEDQVPKAAENSEMVRKCKKLQLHRERLIVDILALTSGLRPACLLDYAPSAPVSVVEGLCKAVSDIYDLQLVTWQWQGCLWVVSHPQLEVRLLAILEKQEETTQCELWALDFCFKSSQSCPTLRTVQQCQEYTQQVQQLLAVMRQHDEVSAEAGGSGAQEQQCCRRHLLQIADEDVLDTVLPFVNGVLLGYPFVYCVSAENVNRACSWLSTTDLLLCGFTGEPKQALVGTGQDQQKQVAKLSDHELWRCSVPLETVNTSGKVVNVMTLWNEWSAGRIQAVPEGWKFLKPFARQVSMQAIVL